MKQARLCRLASVILLLPGTLCAAPTTWSVTSPNGQIKISVSATGPRLSYRVEHMSGGRMEPVILDSPLGLHISGREFAPKVMPKGIQSPKAVVDNYQLPHGKRLDCRNEASELTLPFKNAAGDELQLDLRAYNNGIAFRYRLMGSGNAVQVLDAELTGFALPRDSKIWCAPADKASTYAPAYETYYQSEADITAVAENGCGWSFPLLFRTGDNRHWALITEANNGTNFCGTRLSNQATNGIFTIDLPRPGEGAGTGDVHPASTLPWQMPWRVIVIGDSPATIVESTLVTDVCDVSRMSDVGWVRPGRVAWSWWGDPPSPKDAGKQKLWIDLAAEMGWEYVLVDANWTIMEKGNIHDVINYAKEKGIGVLLWYNSGGPHNVVTEKPRDSLTYQPVCQFELKMLREWGVKGVKVDFFQSDKQNVFSLYQNILRDAAQEHIMVNFHGCTLPRGWEKTYPHLMSMEAVRGEECYIFDSKYPDAAPIQNTILPFTRNAVGPMDYTPVGLSNNTYPHKTTAAHELALTVIFESGWLHFADRPATYLKLAAEPKQFLKEVPVAWDETRFIEGYPGKFVVLGRRKGDVWYVAGINGQNAPRPISLNLQRWLKEGAYEQTLIADGTGRDDLNSARKPVQPADPLVVQMAPFGGFIAVFTASK